MSASLTYYDGGVPTTVDLPGPAFGDSISLPHKVKLQLSMSGSIRTTKRTQANGKLLMSFDSLTIEEYTLLMAVIELANGREMRYVGPQGLWAVKAPATVERSARNRNYYSVTLELIGTQTTDTSRLLRLANDTGYLLLQTGSYLLLEG